MAKGVSIYLLSLVSMIKFGLRSTRSVCLPSIPGLHDLAREVQALDVSVELEEVEDDVVGLEVVGDQALQVAVHPPVDVAHQVTALERLHQNTVLSSSSINLQLPVDIIIKCFCLPFGYDRVINRGICYMFQLVVDEFIVMICMYLFHLNGIGGYD
jgi:hypothetical protein